MHPKKLKMEEMTVTCAYCGAICEGTGTRDHVVARSIVAPRASNESRRGSLKNNMVFACRLCNYAKNNMSVEDFRKTKYYIVNCASGRWKGYVLKK